MVKKWFWVSILVLLILSFDIFYNHLTLGSALLIIDPKHVTRVSPFYAVVKAREYLQSLFIFGNQDLTNWHLTLAQKRVEEAQTLKRVQLFNLMNQVIAELRNEMEIANYFLDLEKGKSDVNYLIQKRYQVKDALKALN